MKILLTGAGGFTGQHFKEIAEARGAQVCPLLSDITDYEALHDEILNLNPTHVVHLAALSAVTQPDALAFYKVNVLGTLNILKALTALSIKPHKVLLASSANVYGNTAIIPITEALSAAPVNHYAMSKLAMEQMARTYLEQLPIVFARPFNYTGLGQDQRFVIPKLVDHFIRRADSIELGNIEVEREYNDVRSICDAYLKLLNQGEVGEIYNVCSGKAISLRSVLKMLEAMTGHTIKVKTNPELVRANEIRILAGSGAKLEACIGPLNYSSLEETLSWMLRNKK